LERRRGIHLLHINLITVEMTSNSSQPHMVGKTGFSTSTIKTVQQK